MLRICRIDRSSSSAKTSLRNLAVSVHRDPGQQVVHLFASRGQRIERSEELANLLEGEQFLMSEDGLDGATDPRPVLDLSRDGTLGGLRLLFGYREEAIRDLEGRTHNYLLYG